MQLPFSRFEKSALLSVCVHGLFLGALRGPVQLPHEADATPESRVLRVARVVRPNDPPPAPRRLARPVPDRLVPVVRREPVQRRGRSAMLPRLALRSEPGGTTRAPQRSTQRELPVSARPTPGRRGGDSARSDSTAPPSPTSPVPRDSSTTLPERGPLRAPEAGGTYARNSAVPAGPVGGDASRTGPRTPGTIGALPGTGLGRPGAGPVAGGEGTGRGTAGDFAGPKRQPAPGGGDGERSLAPVGENEGYSGVIIDCSGLGLARAMSPRLCVTNKDNVRWGEDSSFDQVISVGIVAYYHSVGAARAGRAGKRPLIIRARGVTGPGPWYPVVAPGDLARMKQVDRAWDALKRCQVAFIQ